MQSKQTTLVLPVIARRIQEYTTTDEFLTLSKKERQFVLSMLKMASAIQIQLDGVYTAMQTSKGADNHKRLLRELLTSINITINEADKINSGDLNTTVLSIQLLYTLRQLKEIYYSFGPQSSDYTRHFGPQLNAGEKPNAFFEKLSVINRSPEKRLSLYAESVQRFSQYFILSKSKISRGSCFGYVMTWSKNNNEGYCSLPKYNYDVVKMQNAQQCSKLIKSNIKIALTMTSKTSWAREIIARITMRETKQHALLLHRTNGSHIVGIRSLPCDKYEFFDPNLGQYIISNKERLNKFLLEYHSYCKKNKYVSSECIYLHTNTIMYLPLSVQREIPTVIQPGFSLAKYLQTIISKKLEKIDAESATRVSAEIGNIINSMQNMVLASAIKALLVKKLIVETSSQTTNNHRKELITSLLKKYFNDSIAASSISASHKVEPLKLDIKSLIPISALLTSLEKELAIVNHANVNQVKALISRLKTLNHPNLQTKVRTIMLLKLYEKTNNADVLTHSASLIIGFVQDFVGMTNEDLIRWSSRLSFKKPNLIKDSLATKAQQSSHDSQKPSSSLSTR